MEETWLLVRRLWCHILGRLLTLAACLLIVLAATWPTEPVRADADPTLTLDPDRASCTDRIVVRGRDFLPGQALTLIAFWPGGGNATPIGRATVPSDGTFAIEVEVREFAGSCEGETALRDGTRFIINAVIDQGPSLGGPLSTATFTLSSASAASPSPPGLPNTGGGGTWVRTPSPAGPLVVSGFLAVAGAALLGGARCRRRTG